MTIEATNKARAGIERYAQRNFKPNGEVLTAFYDQLILEEAREEGAIKSEERILGVISTNQDPTYQNARRRIVTLCNAYRKSADASDDSVAAIMRQAYIKGVDAMDQNGNHSNGKVYDFTRLDRFSDDILRSLARFDPVIN